MSSSSPLTAVAIFTNMAISTILGIFIALAYRQFFAGVLFQKSYAIGLVLVTLVTTMVIMVISGNLVLSLGMVGALSIVRFRAAIKDPLDIVYMFWAVGVGIANGVSFFLVSIVSSVFIAVVLYLIKMMPSLPKPQMVVMSVPDKKANDLIGAIMSIDRKAALRSQSMIGDNVELVFETRSKSISFDDIKRQVGEELSEVEIRILNYSGNN